MIPSTTQDFALSVAAILRHGARVHGRGERVTWTGGTPRRATFAEIAWNAGRPAAALGPFPPPRVSS